MLTTGLIMQRKNQVFLTDFFYLFTLFKRLFASTSYGPISKFWFLESLGKSIGKKGSQIWKLLFIKGVKFLRKKMLFFGQFFLISWIFLVLVLLSALVEKFFVSWMRDFFWEGIKKNCCRVQILFFFRLKKKCGRWKTVHLIRKIMIKNCKFNIDCILAM